MDAKPENSSIIDLALNELYSGDGEKALQLSEELIKKDIGDANGWAIKALAQSHLFDYDHNSKYLKSSDISLEEFRSKTNLPSQDIINIEAVYTNVLLERTIKLVNARIDHVKVLRAEAEAEKEKAMAARAAAAVSVFAAMNSKSNTGKVIGWSGWALSHQVKDMYNESSGRIETYQKEYLD